MDVRVVTLGKIRLPLAVPMATQWHRVRGVDTDAHTIDLFNRGREPFPGEADLDVCFQAVVGAGSLTAITAEWHRSASAMFGVVPRVAADRHPAAGGFDIVIGSDFLAESSSVEPSVDCAIGIRDLAERLGD